MQRNGCTLAIRAVRKLFGSVRAVDGFTLSVTGGECIALLGPSGCGKTTLLRIVAGLEQLDEGSVELGGQECTYMAPQKRDVALVFQNYALYPHRTVRGNVEYPLRLRGVGARERRVRTEEIAGLLRISSLLDRKPRQLSSGEAQRVALARALVREPACFLMDEPLSNLDAQLRLDARAEIRRLQRRLSVTTVYVTHDQEDALGLADRLAIMDRGRLVQVGVPDVLFQRPATVLVAALLGKPPMNLLPGVVLEKTDDATIIGLGDAEGGGGHFSARVKQACRTGQRLIIGLRPTDLMLAPRMAEANRKDDELHLPARVELLEGVEPDLIVHCQSAVGKLLVRASRRLSTGDVQLAFETAKAHLFDAESGARIE